MTGHTPEEAQRHWCPFVRLYNPKETGASGYNWLHIEGRDASAMDWRDTSCKGELCMAWRWLDTAKQRGYCGMAGKN
ncbi:hypothetical protein [Magnetococcus sp. PR-3]|uniref:hypothetical protein n=1 Tax=Magnetococcus sp. PR-3 TaxID=3120355 RepID=UPI002FCE12BD